MDKSSLHKFAPGRETDLPASYRFLGDKSDNYPDAVEVRMVAAASSDQSSISAP